MIFFLNPNILDSADDDHPKDSRFLLDLHKHQILLLFFRQRTVAAGAKSCAGDVYPGRPHSAFLHPVRDPPSQHGHSGGAAPTGKAQRHEQSFLEVRFANLWETIPVCLILLLLQYVRSNFSECMAITFQVLNT